MKIYDGILNIFSKIVEFVTGLLLTSIVLIISWQVLTRVILKVTPSWSEEISMILVVWFGMLGAGLGVRDKSHLAVEFLVRIMPDGLKQFFFRLSYALICCFSIVMVVAGFRLYSFVMAHGEINPATGIPVGYTYFAIPVAGIFIFLHSLRHIIDLMAGTYDFTEFAEDASGEGVAIN